MLTNRVIPLLTIAVLSLTVIGCVAITKKVVYDPVNRPGEFIQVKYGAAAYDEWRIANPDNQLTLQAFEQWWASLPRDTRLTLKTLHQNKMMAEQARQRALQAQQWSATQKLFDGFARDSQRRAADRREFIQDMEIDQLKFERSMDRLKSFP